MSPDEETWLQTLLPRQAPPGLADDGFRARLLQRLPPRERPWLGAASRWVVWAVGLSFLLMLMDGEVVPGVGTDSLAVPLCLGTALLWYLADR